MFELTTGTPVNLTEADLYAGTELDPATAELSPDTADIPGLKVSKTGITGTPTTPGTYRVTAGVPDGYGSYYPEATIVLNVKEPAVPDTPETLPVKVCKFLGLRPEGEALALAEQHARVVTTFVHGYTRGRGFTARIPNMDLEDVIISATARYVVNPQQAARQQIGEQSILYATLEGFTLAEKAVLHRYRRRTA